MRFASARKHQFRRKADAFEHGQRRAPADAARRASDRSIRMVAVAQRGPVQDKIVERAGETTATASSTIAFGGRSGFVLTRSRRFVRGKREARADFSSRRALSAKFRRAAAQFVNRAHHRLVLARPRLPADSVRGDDDASSKRRLDLRSADMQEPRTALYPISNCAVTGRSWISPLSVRRDRIVKRLRFSSKLRFRISISPRANGPSVSASFRFSVMTGHTCRRAGPARPCHVF